MLWHERDDLKGREKGVIVPKLPGVNLGLLALIVLAVIIELYILSKFAS